jgi:group I intron endonuclease
MVYRTPDALCGVYRITNIVNNKVYIGQSINIKARWKEHINALRRGDSRCTLLQRAWNKYKEHNFTFEILELCTEEELDFVEIKYIKLYNAVNNGYNIESGGNKNKRLSEETKKKLRESHLGKKMSEETIQKMSNSRMGSKNPMYGKTHSPEARKKISEAHKGKPSYTPTEETKEKIRKANIGKITSAETRKKISEAAMGRPAWNKNTQPVYCVELNRIFDSASEAGKQLEIRSSNIINCCEHTRKTCGGYHWMYADSDEYFDYIKSITIQN